MGPFRIISTLGPRSLTADFLATCRRLGHASVRLNGSHLTAAELASALALVRAAEGPFEVTLDLQGGKRRLGSLEQARIVATGDRVRLVAGGQGSANDVPVPHPDLLSAASVGDLLCLMDGAVRMRVLAVGPSGLDTRVEKGGTLTTRGGIRLEGFRSCSETVAERDGAQIGIAQEFQVEALALSYAANEGSVRALREEGARLGYRPRLIAKIESPAGLDALDGLCRAADELWFCRGDLGMHVPLGALGRHQQETLRVAATHGVPCLVAGQVFHHLVDHAEPTRSEVVHLYDVRRAGAAGVVLSDETAIGLDPARALSAVVSLL